MTFAIVQRFILTTLFLRPLYNWQPYRLSLAIVKGAGAGFLCIACVHLPASIEVVFGMPTSRLRQHCPGSKEDT